MIFLDSTGKTDWQWQLRWLDELLAEDSSKARIIFMGDPPLHPAQSAPFDQSDDYLQPSELRKALLGTVEKCDVNAIISANLSLYDEQITDSTLFITTGGAAHLLD
ncbi:MAG: hypothetical protein V7760_12235 [Marinobacter sp.]